MEHDDSDQERPEHWMLSPGMRRAKRDIARQLRSNPTPSERILWTAIRYRQLQGRKFRRQMAIGPFIVDFYCPQERLAVEIDGPIHTGQEEADRQRQALVETLGIRFVRVTSAQVEENLAEVLEKIQAAFVPTHTATPGSAST